MFFIPLTAALLILATTVTTQDNTHNDLSIEEWKILKKEYFLQQFMEQLEKEPTKVFSRTPEDEEAKKIQKIEMKNEEKRTQGYHNCPSNIVQNQEHPCCMDSVEIDFHQLGWDFILSPTKIQYKFCRGSCNPEFVRPALFTEAAAQILYVSTFN